MRATLIVASFFAAFGGARLLAAQDQAPIEQQLKGQYHITRVGTNGVVLQAGSVLVIQQDNIKATPASYQSYYPNSFKGGRVRQSVIQNLNHLPAKSVVRLLQVGEKVYVTNIESKPADVVFTLQSCGACNPSAVDPNDAPYRAELSFQFSKGFVDSANFKEIQDAIGQVFAIARADNPIRPAGPTAPLGEPKAPVVEAPLAPIQPPPPPADQPPPPPKTVAKGDTKDQVVAAFGQPVRMVKLDTKEIYYYKDLKVTFLNGKVADVE